MAFHSFGIRLLEPTSYRSNRLMQITGSNLHLQQLQYAVAVERQAQATVREQGQQAVQLIEAAAVPATSADTGGRLNIVA